MWFPIFISHKMLIEIDGILFHLTRTTNSSVLSRFCEILIRRTNCSTLSAVYMFYVKKKKKKNDRRYKVIERLSYSRNIHIWELFSSVMKSCSIAWYTIAFYIPFNHILVTFTYDVKFKYFIDSKGYLKVIADICLVFHLQETAQNNSFEKFKTSFSSTRLRKMY